MAGGNASSSVAGRAPAPILSPGLFHTAQSLPASKTTTITPSPSLDLYRTADPVMSPPPKSEADDYLSIHGHLQDPKDRRKKTKEDDVREIAAERLKLFHRPSYESQATGSANSIKTFCIAHDQDAGGVVRSTSDVQNPEAASLVGPLDDLRNTSVAESTHNAGSVTWALSDTPSPPAGVEESPAVNSLRNLSNSGEPQGLRRISRVLTSAFHFLKIENKPNESIASTPNVPEDQEPLVPRKPRRLKSLAFQDLNQHQSKPRLQASKGGAGMLTPSSITLRKASDANASLPRYLRSSMTASLGHEGSQLRCPDTPSSELLAFYSSTSTDLDRLKPITDSSAAATRSTSTSKLSTPFQPYAPQPKKTLQSSPLLAQGRRRSTLAATALTFTDVHVAPRTFAVDPIGRKQSITIPQEVPRRVSVVQFHTRNSVHEVIWREDESTSSSSLTTTSRNSSSPRTNRQTPLSGQQSPEASNGMRSAPTMSNIPEQPVSTPTSDASQPGLFQWSWQRTQSLSPTAPLTDTSPPRNLHEPESNHEPVLPHAASTSNPDPTRPKGADDPKAPLTAAKRSASALQDISSFPPLNDRRTTLEWRGGPLVDLNDPLDGRMGPGEAGFEAKLARLRELGIW